MEPATNFADFGAFPLMNEGMEMQHIQFLDSGIFNE